MSRAPAFQFYAADYLADEHVQVMTLEQEGIYVRLLAYCWREGSIPADITLLSRLCKNAPADSLNQVIERFEVHPERPDRLVHPRLEAERSKQADFRSERSKSGTKGAKKRWGPKPPNRKNGSANSSAIGLPLAKNGSSFSSSSSSSSSSNRSDLDHTHNAATQKPVCVSKSKFTLQQIRQYAWASWRLDQRLVGQGRKNVDGIRNPDGWAISAHRSGDYDELIQEWIDNPQLFALTG
jgi:uncharacterized protein YdaU (DUF1376 family)